MERIDRQSPDAPPSALPRWMVLAPVVALASALAIVAASAAGEGVEAPIAQPADAGAPLERVKAIDPHPPALVEHISALPDEEQAPTF